MKQEIKFMAWSLCVKFMATMQWGKLGSWARTAVWLRGWHHRTAAWLRGWHHCWIIPLPQTMFTPKFESESMPMPRSKTVSTPEVTEVCAYPSPRLFLTVSIMLPSTWTWRIYCIVIFACFALPCLCSWFLLVSSLAITVSAFRIHVFCLSRFCRLLCLCVCIAL